MSPRSKFRATLLLAALATVPAFAAAADESQTVPSVTVYEASITVHGRRAAEDDLITHEVVLELARDPRLSGHIGVETQSSDVTLSGLVTTPGQADRAGRDAHRVEGVRNVRNDLRSRVGED
jgi:osmotically-inducible protein OsmY